jgi:sporulation protein YlmC with PRC-barrel domain
MTPRKKEEEMALRIEDVSSLPGREVVDQEGGQIGEIKDVYGIGEDEEPMWVAIEISTDEMVEEEDEGKIVIVPLARIREEDENLSVPYSLGHIKRAPEVEAEDEISEDDDNKLRIYYSIGLADDEFLESNSYAGQRPEGEAPAKKITDDLDDKETPGGESRDRSAEERHEEYAEQDIGGS